jgi:hypothetical protein
MPSLVAQLVLFGSSFAPLFLLFGLLNSFGKGLPSILCFVAAAVSALALRYFMRRVQQKQTLSITVVGTQKRDQDAIGYLVTYLLPFVSVATATWREQAALVLFIALIALLYVRAGLIYVNPLLAAARYRLFEADMGTGHSVIIITRRRYVAPGSMLELKTVTEDVYVEASFARGRRARRGGR